MEYKQFTGTSENITELSDWLDNTLTINFNNPEEPFLKYSQTNSTGARVIIQLYVGMWLGKDSNGDIEVIQTNQIELYKQKDIIIKKEVRNNQNLYKVYFVNKDELVLICESEDVYQIKQYCWDQFTQRIPFNIPFSIKYVAVDKTNLGFSYEHTEWVTEFTQFEVNSKLTISYYSIAMSRRFDRYLKFVASLN